MLKFHLWRPGNLRAWLFSIMHNVFVNQLKAQQDLAFGRGGRELRRGDHARLGHRRARPRAGLAALPAEQREVVLMVSLEDMSYEEVSRALGMPIGTVMSRLSRGREKLRRHMDGEATSTSLKVVQ